MTEPSDQTPVPSQERSLAAATVPDAIVVWRGERIAAGDLPARIARTDDRFERERLFRAYLDALEAINPRLERRLQDRRPEASDSTFGVDPAALAADVERLVLHTETPYYAALRRYLALIDIEQGDGTLADLWHVALGSAWAEWFGDREAARAVAATGRTPAAPSGLTGWLAAERMMRGDAATTPGAAAVGAAWATLIGSPAWLEAELGMAADQVVPFVDFATFVRLWRLRHAIATLQYELRVAVDADPNLARPYYRGIVGHMTGVLAPEEMYLVAIDDEPFASAREIVSELLAASLVDVLENRHGTTWWRDPAAGAFVETMGATTSFGDALAQLGYDALDWRPVLRQIRTRLIGEMSGYGGPNITTRAGTRKV